MEKRRFENLGIESSVLGYGCMRFPLKEDGSIDEIESQKSIDHAYAKGVTYFDTAYVYHQQKSEDFTGRALQKYPRDTFTIATKMPLLKVKNREEAHAMVLEQLNNLHMDYIDFYLLHSLDKARWDFVVEHDILGLLEEMRDEGKIRYIGFSFHDKYDVFDEIIHYRKWDFCQIQLNYIDIEDQAGMKGYEVATELDIPVVIMEPARGGALTNFSPELNQKFYDLDKEKSIASYAFRFVGQLPNVKVILSGMTKFEHLEDNLKTFSPIVPLNGKEAELVNEIYTTLRSRMKNTCTGCNYCMPCPHGVNIPNNFRQWNNYGMYQLFSIIAWQYHAVRANNTSCDACVGCGICVKECPQQINIPENLKRMSIEFKDLDKK